jgi:methylated-DNA-[protein]-cysteine S-methyltransferase
VALRFRTVTTRLGEVAFVMDERGLRRVYLPQCGGVQALRAKVQRDLPAAKEDPGLERHLADQLRRYFKGEPIKFDVQLSLDAEGASDFRHAVWSACHQIPYGQTASYGDLARSVGRPGAARAVGTAMRYNPCPIVVPCHRVLGCNNTIGGYSGPGGVEFKRRLLEMESAAHV